MTYGCSGNGFHTSWGQQNCGDVVRAFAITGQNLVVAKPLLLDYEMLYTSLGASNLAVTVRIINDGHGQCEGVSGGPLMSEQITLEVSVEDINEAPTSALSLVCTPKKHSQTLPFV